MSKRKKSPLDQWRIDYHYIANNLRELKRRIRSGADWGTFNAGKQQAMLNGARSTATIHMIMRGQYADESRRLYEDRQAARATAIAAGKGHNSKKATD